MAKAKQTARSLREAVLDGQPVTLLNGDSFHVRPWGIEQRHDLLPILGGIIQEILIAGAEMGKLEVADFITRFSAQIDALVQITVGYDDEKMRTLSLEDSLKLSRIVTEVCVIREDGGGPLGELFRLYGVGVKVVKTVLTPGVETITEALPGDPTNGKTNSTTRSGSSSTGVTRLKTSEH